MMEAMRETTRMKKVGETMKTTKGILREETPPRKETPRTHSHTIYTQLRGKASNTYARGIGFKPTSRETEPSRTY